MDASEAMEVAEDLALELHELHDKVEEAKRRFEDVWAAIDTHDDYTQDHAARFKKGSWDLACALGALQEAADMMDEAYDLLDDG